MEIKKEFSFDDLSSLIKKPKSLRMSMVRMDDNLFRDKPPVIFENNEEFKADEIEQLKLNNRIKNIFIYFLILYEIAIKKIGNL